jgi:uncharacterized protein YggE
MNSYLRALTIFFLMSLGQGTALHAQAEGPRKDLRTVTVQGQGQLKAAPDMARITAGVSQDGSSAQTVSTHVRETIAKVLDAVKGQGIVDKDIQTEFYSVTPKWDWSNGQQRRSGYTVSNQVLIKVHDLKKVGSLLSAITDAGATTVTGPSFEFEHPEALERKTLALAMEDAKAKAAILAEAAGASLGPVFSIEQNGAVNWARPMVSHMAMAAKAVAVAPPEPIETGEQDFNSSITATFTLK